MPKIPVYQQQVSTATGSLSPRAGAGAFTAPGQALAQFADTVTQIADNFVKEERRDEDERVLSEFRSESNEAFTNQLLDDSNVIDNTSDAKIRNQEIKNTLASKIKGQNLNKRREKLLLRSLDLTASQFSLKGQQNAFTLGRAKKVDSNNKSLDIALEQISSSAEGSLEQQFQIDNVNRIYKSAELDGSSEKLNFTKEQFFKSVEAKSSETLIRGANDFERLETMRQSIAENPNITQDNKIKLFKQITLKKKEINEQSEENNLNKLITNTFEFSVMQQIENAANNGESITVKNEDNEDVFFNFKNMNATTRISFNGKLDKLDNDKRDEKITNNVDILSDKLDVSPISLMSELSLQMKNAKTAEEKNVVKESIIAFSNSQLTLANQRMIDGDFQGAEYIMRNVESVLTDEFSGEVALFKNEGTYGKNANTILSSISSTRAKINTVSQELQKDIVLKNAIINGTYGEQQLFINAKPQQVQRALREVIKGKSMLETFQVLQSNNLKSDDFKLVLTNAYKDSLNNNLNENTQKSIGLYRDMKVIGGKSLANDHVTDEQEVFFNSVLLLENTGMSRENAIAQVVSSLNSDIDIKARQKPIQEATKQLLDNVESGKFLFFGGLKPVNRSYVADRIQKIANLYIATGLSEQDAVEQAAELLEGSHINLEGQLIPKSENYPVNLPEMAKLAVEDFRKKHANDIEDSDNLSIIPLVEGDAGSWLITMNGMPTSFIKNAKPVYKLSSMQDLVSDEKVKQIGEIIKAQAEKQETTIFAIEEAKKKREKQRSGFVSEGQSKIIEERKKETPETRNFVKSTAFGKETFYKKRGKKYYRVKSDGSLASTPVNVLVQKQLDNQFNPLVEVVQEPLGKDFGIIEEK